MKKHVCPIILALALTLAAFAVACGGSAEPATTDSPGATDTAAVTDTAAGTDTAPGTDTGATETAGLQIKGLVATPMTLSYDDLAEMNVTTITVEHPKNGTTEYTGVLFSDVMAAAGVQTDATTVVIGAYDGYMAEITLADLDPQAMIAFGDDGALDGVMPGMEGKAWVSDIRSLDFK